MEKANFADEKINRDLPRADLSALGSMAETIERSRTVADRMGISEDIERLAYEGKKAAEIAVDIRKSLDPKELEDLKKELKNADLSQFVRQVRTSLGIPQGSTEEAWEQWKKGAAGRVAQNVVEQAPEERERGEREGRGGVAGALDGLGRFRVKENSRPPEREEPVKGNEKKEALLAELHERFQVSSTGRHYRLREERADIGFTDRGERMLSRSNDQRVAEGMAIMAEAKGWQTIKVSGHPDFQREVWMAAKARGIEVRGFSPSEHDLKEYEARRDLAARNGIERRPDGPGPERTGPSIEKSGETDREKVLKAVAEAIVRERIQGPEVTTAVKAVLGEVNRRLEQGREAPAVPMYDPSAPSKAPPERSAPAAERTPERSR